ncbi:MAG: hypothetical protein KDB97_07390 [Flavobacteriales bacterium]|nr:hypothetical protein [Flavobacteriales bacterium]
MSRSIGIGLLVLFLHGLMGTYLAQWALREQAREHMEALVRSGMGEQLVVELRFRAVNGRIADPGFQWVEKNEFRFHGLMYDVVGRAADENIITFRCIADHHETDIVRRAHELEPVNGVANGRSGPRIKFDDTRYLPLSTSMVPMDGNALSLFPSDQGTVVRSGFAPLPWHPPAA